MAVYVSLSCDSLIIVKDGEKQVISLGEDPREIALNLKKVLNREVSDLEKKEIFSKYNDKIYYPFDKENAIKEIYNNRALEGVFENNEKNINRLRDIAIEFLNLKIKDSMDLSKICVLLYDSLASYERIVNESVIRIKELCVYLYPGVYERYTSNKEFVKDVAEGKVKYKAVLDRIVDDERYISLVRDMAKRTLEMYKLIEKIEKTLEKMVEEIMPNTSYLIGPKLTAKLLSESGSLEKLALMPSSTIQVIGAEKALFMHLLGRGKSPKHGVIFLSPYIQKAPKRHRGRIARVLSLKISKAVKMDYFSRGKQFIGDQLKKEMDEFISKILGKN